VKFSVAGVETLNVTTDDPEDDAAVEVMTVDLDTDATTLNISGDTALDLSGIALTTVKTVSAAGLTGALTIGQATPTT
jgi:hypothetical protein